MTAAVIAMVGMPGAGKSVVGYGLAKRLSFGFVDLDAAVARAEGAKISELFRLRGERGFRAAEARALQQVLCDDTCLREDGLVLSLGGGALMDPSSRALVTRLTRAVYLRCRLDTLTQRVALNNNRPLLAGPDSAAKLKAMLELRGPQYMEAAEFVIDSDDWSVTQTVDRVHAWLGGAAG